jgi:DNA helicase II / ATP-dependent DNA helicase PcrA
VICDEGDYVALRVMLGLLGGVGLTTTNGIATKTVAHNLNYRDLFFRPLPDAVFSTRESRALDSVRSVTTTLGGWSGDDTLALRRAEVRASLARLYGDPAADLWDDLQAQLPDGSTLKEVRDILWSDNDEQASAAELAIYERLGLEPPEAAGLPPRVRLMTMHRAKGLGAQVVFIPGLEEAIFPGDRRGRYPGLVLEAARLLYVSMTRARAACIVSYARRRTRFGTFRSQTPSRFIADIGIQVEDRADGLSRREADALENIVADL